MQNSLPELQMKGEIYMKAGATRAMSFDDLPDFCSLEELAELFRDCIPYGGAWSDPVPAHWAARHRIQRASQTMGGWVDQYQMDGRRKTKRFQRKSDAKAFIDSMNTAETAV